MKLIIDCDPANGIPASDVDDGLAIALAWESPDVELLAVTVVDGNAAQQHAAAIAAGLAILAGAETPVHSSDAVPVVEDRSAWRAVLDARGDALSRELWADAPAALSGQPASTDAPAQLVRLADEHPDATLVAIGPLTNLAAAEALVSGTLRRFAQVVVLGGAFTGPIGVRELNFALDPEAAQAVLSSGAATTLVPLDVTRTTWLTISDLSAIAQGDTTPLVDHLLATARPWVRWISESRGWRGANAHDLLAVAAAIRPEIVSWRDAALAIELAGPDRSRPYEVGPGEAGSTIRLVTGFDEQKFGELVRGGLSRGTATMDKGEYADD